MALSAALLLSLPFVGRSQDQIPVAINYQGRLTDTLGNPVSSGYYEVEFRIWDDPTLANAGDLIWGRSFPLHVVTNGLFDVLLTDDGGQITTPITPTNTLLTAFSGPNRYLGLTITVSNGVPVSGPEISPRQQLASAPYAIQAQTANTVAPLGVPSTALASGSVVAGKIGINAVTSGTIANSAVTTDKLADKVVTTAKLATSAVTTTNIADGAVTASKLNLNGDIRLNDHAIYLRGGADTASGLKYAGSFAGSPYDGPALFGDTNGVLGTTSGGEKAALSWNNTGAVSLFGPPIDITSNNYPTIQGNGDTPVQTGSLVKLKALTDGIFVYYDYAQRVYIQIYAGGTKALFPGYDTTTSSFPYRAPGDGYGMFINPVPQGFAFGKQVMWPMRKGDTIQIYLHSTFSTAVKPKLYFIPLGTAVTATPSAVIQNITQ